MPPNFPAGTTRRDFTRNRVKKPKIYRRYAPEPCKWCKKAQNCPRAGYAPRERLTAPDFPAQIKCGSTAFFPHLAHEVWPLFGVCVTTILSHWLCVCLFFPEGGGVKDARRLSLLLPLGKQRLLLQERAQPSAPVGAGQARDANAARFSERTAWRNCCLPSAASERFWWPELPALILNELAPDYCTQEWGAYISVHACRRHGLHRRWSGVDKGAEPAPVAVATTINVLRSLPAGHLPQLLPELVQRLLRVRSALGSAPYAAALPAARPAAEIPSP